MTHEISPDAKKPTNTQGGGMNQHTRRRLELDSSYINERTYESPLVMEYVAGAHPYLWIGDNRGWCFATVDADKLKSFLKGEKVEVGV